MAWPQPTEYFDAVQNPAARFADPQLARGQAVVDSLGLPICCSGNFADVYQIQGPADENWAVKCFTREVPGLKERYQQISRHLQSVALPFLVSFDYQDQGIRIRDQWFPILKMRWVEGDSLNRFVEKNLERPQLLEVLLQMWLKLAQQLDQARIAHCDLQHGNVLLVPRANNRVRLTLVDYDGMLVPALAQQPSGELGHPCYQHPQRLREGTYCPQADRFSHLVICCGLSYLICGGQRIWQRHDNGDNLLFRPNDFANPAASPLFQELWTCSDARVHALTGRLILGCRAKLEELGPVDAGVVGELPTEMEQEVQNILSPNPKAGAVMPLQAASSATTTSVSEPWWTSQETQKETKPAGVDGRIPPDAPARPTPPPDRAPPPIPISRPAVPISGPAPTIPRPGANDKRMPARTDKAPPTRMRLRRFLLGTGFFLIAAAMVWLAAARDLAEEDKWLQTLEDHYEKAKLPKGVNAKQVNERLPFDFQPLPNGGKLVTADGQSFTVRDEFRVRVGEKVEVRVLETPTRRLAKYWAKFRHQWGYEMTEEDRAAILGISPEVFGWLVLRPIALSALFVALWFLVQALYPPPGYLQRDIYFWGIGLMALALVLAWAAYQGMSKSFITGLILLPLAGVAAFLAMRTIQRSY